jgi:hypothetical protein
MRRPAWRAGLRSPELPTPLADPPQPMSMHRRRVGNLCRFAQRLTGGRPLWGVVGGCHLGGTRFAPLVPRLLDELAELGPELLVPGHRTGCRAQQIQTCSAQYAGCSMVTAGSSGTPEHLPINVANQLFDVHLPMVLVPAVTEQRERFSYPFLYIAGSNAIVGRLLSSLVSSGIARRRASQLAAYRLFDELDKHFGWARHDLAERAAATKRHLVAAMFPEFDQTEASRLAVAKSARTLLSLKEEERRERDSARSDLRAIVVGLARVVGLSSEAP